MNVKVSIVIPVFNGADYLAQAIDSALAQSYGNTEVIVVNDGSTDGGATESIARAYGERVRYFCKPNGHVASALNFGIAHMQGDYFSWLSHDDLYHPDKIACQVAAAAREGHGTVLYSYFETLDVRSGARSAECHHVAPAGFRLWLTRGKLLHGCTLLVPRAAFAKCGLFDESLRTTQDYDMWFRIAAHYRFVHVPRVLVTGRMHAAQGSRGLHDVAQREGDELLRGFVAALSPAELAAGIPGNPCIAYVHLAVNLGDRGFARASGQALALSRAAASRYGFLRRGYCRIAAAGVRLAHGAVAKSRRVRALIGGNMRSAIVKLLGRFDRSYEPVRSKFSRIYRENIFGSHESRSGGGSTLEQTATLRRAIPALLGELGARSLIDAPCGDFNWMSCTPLDLDRYIGIDIVDELIRADQERYGSPKREFLCRDIIVDPLPAVEVILCRDCLVHLTFDQALKAIGNFRRSGSTYLLTTTFSERDTNVDLKGKDIWRTLNLECAPFNFPPPLRLVNENCTEGDGAYRDKCLGLWRLADLPA